MAINLYEDTMPSGNSNGNAGSGASGAPASGASASAPASGPAAPQAGTPGECGEPGGSLLTRDISAAGTTGQNGQANGKEIQPGTPEAFALEFAEQTIINQELLGCFCSTAHKLGLNRDQAQGLARLYEEHLQGTEKTQLAALKGTIDNWERQIQEAPGFMADCQLARRTLAVYGNPELYQLLDESCLGSHPAMFRFMASVGKALGEPGFYGNSNAPAQLSPESILYPGMNKRNIG